LYKEVYTKGMAGYHSYNNYDRYDDFNDFMRQNAGVYDGTFKGEQQERRRRSFRRRQKAFKLFNAASVCIDGLIILVNLLTFFRPRGTVARILFGLLTPLRRIGYTMMRINRYKRMM